MEITHDYVDLEAAKLLKVKGFDCKVTSYYSAPTEYKPEFTIYSTDSIDWNEQDDFPWLFYSAPEHWQVIKFLRLKYNLHTVINFANKNDWYFDLNQIGFDGKLKNVFKSNYDYITPEEAELEAIKYCLNNLIE